MIIFPHGSPVQVVLRATLEEEEESPVSGGCRPGGR